MSERRWPDKFASVFAGVGVGMILVSIPLAYSDALLLENVPLVTYGIIALVAGLVIKERRMEPNRA